MNRAHAAAGGLGLQTLNERIGDERDIRVLEHRLDADDLRIRLAVDQARITVESIATDAGARVQRPAVLFVEQHAKRQREWMMALPLQGIMEFLDARFVRDRRAGIRPARRWVGRVDPVLAMYLVELLGFAIVGLEILISERPSGGSPVMMFDLAEILLAQTKQCRAVHLGIATHPIVDSGMERAAILAVPGLFRLILCIDEDSGGIPIFSFPRQKVTAFQDQDALAAWREPMREGTSPRARADDDAVIMLAGHVGPFVPQTIRRSRILETGSCRHRRTAWRQPRSRPDRRRAKRRLCRYHPALRCGGRAPASSVHRRPLWSSRPRC